MEMVIACMLGIARELRKRNDNRSFELVI